MIAAISCLVAVGFISNCDDRMLPNGYRYVILNSYSAVITTSSGSIVVDTNVEEVVAHGKYITGRRVNYSGPRNFKGESSGYKSGYFGYFILDSSNGKLREGLSRESLQGNLELRGITGTRYLSP